MRLFIALCFDDKMTGELVQAQDGLKKDGMEGYYTVPENLHMTLAFIGEYNDPDRVLEILGQIPFPECCMRFSGFQLYRDMCFLRLGQCSELEGYVRKLRKALSDAGIPFDRKAFSPHVTLARKVSFRNGIPSLNAETPDMDFSAARISLMLSERGKNGMIYTEIGGMDGY